MLNDALYEWQLNVFRVFNLKLLFSLFCTQDDGLVGKDREAHLPSVSNNLYAVCACRFVGAEAPRAAARQSVGELEGGADGVSGRTPHSSTTYPSS